LDGIYEAVERKDARIKPGTLKKLEEGKAKAYLSFQLAHIDPFDLHSGSISSGAETVDQGNDLAFDFDKCHMGKYDQAKVLDLLHALSIRALDNRLPKINESAEK
jgi:5'-3' exonuclease